MPLVANDHGIPHRNLADSMCPLDFTVLRKVIYDSSKKFTFLDIPRNCHTLLQGIRLAQSNYLRVSGNFSLPPNSSDACLDDYQKLVHEYIPWLDIRFTCQFNSTLIFSSCNDITTQSRFEGLVSKSELQDVKHLCNRSLDDDSSCRPCRDCLSSIYHSYFRGTIDGNTSDCSWYPFVYAGALANRDGPADSGAAKCLFSLDFTSTKAFNWRKKAVLCATPLGTVFGLIVAVIVVWRRRQKCKRICNSVTPDETGSGFGIETISGDKSLVKFTFEEIKMATKNFSRENIVGKGGYGNVYKGTLKDGSEVAFKRFKNCSAAGDATFAHEVEVIASINHVNLVPFRGYCTATVPMEGHQRLIVCDLMQNGSLHDHLFGSEVPKISWPIRQKIAIGVARGLAKKAVISIDDHHTLLLTDWAWSLVEEGRLLDVIDETMPELGPPEVMEKYVLVAVLSSHPQLHARPTMDQIVRMLETDSPVHSNPQPGTTFCSSRSMSSTFSGDKNPCNRKINHSF
ncbi:hypothetical protein V6N13_147813 [Hibiscus sabdariffa]